MVPGMYSSSAGTWTALLDWGPALLAHGCHGISQSVSYETASWRGGSSCTLSTLTRTEGSPGCWKVLLWKISWGEDMLGLNGIDWRSNSSLSIVFLKSWLVQSMIFRVLTWHSMSPLDWWKWGEEVMWSIWLHCKNCATSSDGKGRPFSE